MTEGRGRAPRPAGGGRRTKPSLEVDLGGIRFPNPVLAASGCLGTGGDVPGLVDLHRFGGVVSRSLTFGPTKGWPTPRAAETASGLLSAVGLQNPGVRAFVSEDLPRLSRAVPVVASVAGSSLAEYVNVAGALHLKDGVVALEVYLSCPDDDHDGEPFFTRPERLVEIVGAVARMSRVPVFVKLPALLPGLVGTARSCVRAGALGFTLVDSVPGLAIDPGRLRTRTAVPVGGLSGPAIKPVALAAVFQVSQALPNVPIMGVGGIATGEDAAEFLLAGAWAVQVGTALLVDPSAHVRIVRELHGYLRAKGFASPADARGRLRIRGSADATT
jgi:dihydroorotate dehydrogenase (NAD+) catalytic subunit